MVCDAGRASALGSATPVGRLGRDWHDVGALKREECRELRSGAVFGPDLCPRLPRQGYLGACTFPADTQFQNASEVSS